MSLAFGGNIIAGLALNGSAVSACYNGQIVWPESLAVYHNVVIGADSHTTTDATFTFNGTPTSYNGLTANTTITGVPDGATVEITSVIGTGWRVSGLITNGTYPISAWNQTRSSNGRGATASGYITSDTTATISGSATNKWTATGSGNRTASSTLGVSAYLVTRAFTGESVSVVGSIGGNFLNKNSSACSAKISGNLHYTGNTTNVTIDNQAYAAGKYSARRFGFYRYGASIGYMTGRLNATSTNANGAYNATASSNASTPPFSYFIGPTTAYNKPSLGNPPRMTATYTFTATGIAP